jgi:hypothetical protein
MRLKRLVIRSLGATISSGEVCTAPSPGTYGPNTHAAVAGLFTRFRCS